MSDTTAAGTGTNVPAGGTKDPVRTTNDPVRATKDPFRTTIEIAVGPNVTGHDDMARAAHVLPPDPAIVDDPEAPDVAQPRSVTRTETDHVS